MCERSFLIGKLHVFVQKRPVTNEQLAMEDGGRRSVDKGERALRRDDGNGRESVAKGERAVEGDSGQRAVSGGL
jgi:hypothetical protein